MRHGVTTNRLGVSVGPRKALLKLLLTALIKHEVIKTTVKRAKVVRVLAEKMITLAKKKTLHARRLAERYIKDKLLLRKLFDNLGNRYQERKGGYTRIIRIGNRYGDNAEMVLLEFVDRPKRSKKEKKKKEKAEEKVEEKAKEAEAKGVKS